MNKQDFKDHLYSFTVGAVAAAVSLGSPVVGGIAASGAIAAGATPIVVASILALAGLSTVAGFMSAIDAADTLLKNKIFKLKSKTMLTASFLVGTAVLTLPSKVAFTDKESIASLNDKTSTVSFFKGKHLTEKFSATSFTTTNRLSTWSTHRIPSTVTSAVIGIR